MVKSTFVGSFQRSFARSFVRVAVTAWAALPLLAAVAIADDRQLVTLVGAGTSADGTSQIRTQVVAECIGELPTLADLAPVVDSESLYLKWINGDRERNESVRTWTASVDVTYVLHRKEVVVVTTNSVERSEPVIREVDGRFDRTIQFVSNRENGDLFSGRTLVNEYYFSSPEAATRDAMRRAEAWLKQRRSVMCDG